MPCQIARLGLVGANLNFNGVSSDKRSKCWVITLETHGQSCCTRT